MEKRRIHKNARSVSTDIRDIDTKENNALQYKGWIKKRDNGGRAILDGL